MTKTTFLALGALGALSLAACGQQAQQQAEAPQIETPATPAAVVMSDAEFVQAVADAHAFVVQSSELVAERAARQDVKNLAATLIEEHNASLAAMNGVVAGLSISAPAGALDAERTADVAEMRGLSGEAFDDEYLDDMTEQHSAAVSMFESYAQNAAPSPLRDWAQTTLATLRTHRDRVQTLENAT
jgi:putative membrane protein